VKSKRKSKGKQKREFCGWYRHYIAIIVESVDLTYMINGVKDHKERSKMEKYLSSAPFCSLQNIDLLYFT
jgi:hypothetical protein